MRVRLDTFSTPYFQSKDSYLKEIKFCKGMSGLHKMRENRSEITFRILMNHKQEKHQKEITGKSKVNKTFSLFQSKHF